MTTVDHIALSLEQSLDFCIKCNICSASCPVSAVTDKFPGPKYVGPQAQRFRHERQPSPDESVDYCSGCRVCNEVCPTGVKIYELNARARAKIYAEQGIPLRNHLLARSELLGRLACGPQAHLANFGLHNPLLRWIGEKVMGVARKAPVPAFSSYSFRSWFKRRQQARGNRQALEAAGTSKKQVVFFHGCATNYYEPRVGKAAVEVLERNGFEVILARQNCCGLPLISNAAFAAARDYHLANLRSLLPYAKQGIPIVGTSTSCTLTLKEEAPEILGIHNEDAELVARQTFDIFEFLRDLHDQGALDTSFLPVARTLPYHMPCQYRAHRLGRPALDVLELIPGLRIVESNAPCCGIAGTYGFKVEKYDIAMDVGEPLFAFVKRSGSDVALCDSETCRWQITHGAGVISKHPIEILREAYG
jgi:glycerol-3-phosphate dehydrogenase subunit C